MANLSISSLTAGSLAVNCWFLVNEDTKEALIFDPGGEAEKLYAYARKNGWSVRHRSVRL